MFRRSKTTGPSSATPSPETDTGAGAPHGKGRPTPTRREAEAAARARAKKPRSRREQMAAQRKVRGESSARIRQGMKEGDERFMPPRDRGPVRRFVRDFVDSRFSVMELMVPILIVTLLLSWSGSTYLVSMANVMMLGVLVLIVMDMVMLRFRLRRELKRRFPEESWKGTTYYAIVRGMQMKFMRIPKPQVKIGQRLPDTYR